MAFKKNDFIEIDFTGRTQEGDVFDSTLKKELEKLNPDAIAKPFVFSLGNGMFLKSLEDFLISKDIGEYKVTLEPKDGFGERKPSLVQLLPESVFRKHNIRPIVGHIFNFDGKMAKILSASGGRVRVDFNNPLAGKTLRYEIEIKRIVTDINEKVNALNEFFFRQKFEFEISEKKLILSAPKEMEAIVPLFKDKYKEILKLDLEFKESQNKNSA